VRGQPDIVERLLNHEQADENATWKMQDLCREAADTIEVLRAENARLREKLKEADEYFIF
jgi:hypothetical protein